LPLCCFLPFRSSLRYMPGYIGLEEFG
jgi:hypothetical protein